MLLVSVWNVIHTLRIRNYNTAVVTYIRTHILTIMLCDHCGRIKMNVKMTRYFYHFEGHNHFVKEETPSYKYSNNTVYNFLYIDMIIIHQKPARNESSIKMSYMYVAEKML